MSFISGEQSGGIRRDLEHAPDQHLRQHRQEQVLLRVPKPRLSIPTKPHSRMRVLPPGKHGLLSGKLQSIRIV